MRLMSADKLYKQMKERRVYRREELSAFSTAVDRNLKELVKDGRVHKAAAGLYYRPKNSKWGQVPPNANELVRAFLRTDDFYLTSTNSFNLLPLGFTQLSNVAVVYNTKRVGRFRLNGLIFDFRRPGHRYPDKFSEEFLYIDLLNNLDKVPEYSKDLDHKLKAALKKFPSKKLEKSAMYFGTRKAQLKLKELLSDAA